MNRKTWRAELRNRRSQASNYYVLYSYASLLWWLWRALLCADGGWQREKRWEENWRGDDDQLTWTLEHCWLFRLLWKSAPHDFDSDLVWLTQTVNCANRATQNTSLSESLCWWSATLLIKANLLRNDSFTRRWLQAFFSVICVNSSTPEIFWLDRRDSQS